MPRQPAGSMQEPGDAGRGRLLVVGLVGRIGAGKSTVAREFAALGGRVLDADALAHEVLDEPEFRSAIERRFGPGVIGADGRIDRRALGAAVFGGPEGAARLADLEAIVHPPVRARIRGELERLRREAEATGAVLVAVLDVPLLVQAGWATECDRLVLVECQEVIRRQRLARRGWDAEEQSARDASWERRFDPSPLASGKTDVVDTSVDATADPSYTSRQVARLWEAWLAT
jgi:dephospho-CoA kinase